MLQLILSTLGYNCHGSGGILSLFHALPTGMHACRSHFIIITPYLMLRAEYRANIYLFSSLLLPKLQ